MTWFAFTNGHPDINAGGIEEKQLVAYGFHGYATQAEADAHRNSVNLIQTGLLDNLDAISAGNAGSSLARQAATNPAGAAGKIGSAVGGLVPSGFNLVFGNTGGLLGRILKVLFGGVLIVIGVAKLTGADRKLEAIVPLAGKVPG